MNIKQLFVLFVVLISFTIVSCSRVKNKAKSTINKGGEVVGKSAAEFFEGVSEGVEKTLECTITLSDSLQALGVTAGKFSIKSTEGGNNNLLVLYLIFEKDFDGTLRVIANDKAGAEEGRTKLSVKAIAGDAGYHEFPFDIHTHIDVKSEILVE